MDLHYNAFISYRHHPDDIRVATQIHRGLERFKIPKAIKRKQSGPMRLFRDKEELPITSHLTDDIGRALENSDFLIVICSPHTKESVWVQREIETFLQTHSRDKILTVLAEGEPYDVIPEILLYEDVVDPVTGQLQRKEIEPLSCDWRMKKRKAALEELPRLAAPLLGCAYDELRQRQRQYRMRRTVAAFSAALAASLGLSVYFIQTSIRIQKANDELYAANVQIKEANVEIREANVQIRSNLDQALRNQSEYLASAASERMGAGDRLTAIALALEALPDGDNQRPYVAKAEQALSDALNAYQSSEKVTAQGAYVVDALVEEFQLTEDGSRIYIRDARNVVTVWDASTFQKLHTVDTGKYDIQGMWLTPQGNMIFRLNIIGSAMVGVNLNGEELWRVEGGQAMAYLDDGQTAMILQHDYQQLHQMLFLDPDTGVPTREPLPLEKGEDEAYAVAFLQEVYQSGQPVTLRYFSSDTNQVALLDLETGTVKFLVCVDTSYSGTDQSIDAAGIVQNGNVVVMRGDGSGMYNGSYDTQEVTSMDRADVLCFDGKSGKLLWQSEIITYLYASDSIVAPIPDSDWVLLQSGNTFLVCDSLTGREIAQCQSATRPMYVDVGSQYASGILKNGNQFIFNYENNNCSASRFYDGTVDMAVANQGFFVHAPMEMQVTAYWTDKDEDGVEFDCQLAYSTRYHELSGDRLAIKTYDTLYMLDVQQQALLWSQEMKSGWVSLGFSTDGEVFWMWNSYDDYAAAISAADGSRREVNVPISLGDELYTSADSNFYLYGDRLTYILENEAEMCLLQADLQTGEVLSQMSLAALMPQEIIHSANSKILLVTDTYVWLYRDEGALFVIHLPSGRIDQIAEGMLAAPTVAFGAVYNQVMVGIDHAVKLMNLDGRLIREIGLEDRKAVGMHFFREKLLVLCDDGKLYRYDREGKLLSQTTLHLFNTFTNYDPIDLEDPMDLAWWVTEDGDLILNVFRAGNIVDCESWEVRAFVPYLSTYAAGSDTLLCMSNARLYAYPRYTTQQQKEKGLQALGDFRLSEELRSYYGLG